MGINYTEVAERNIFNNNFLEITYIDDGNMNGVTGALCDCLLDHFPKEKIGDDAATEEDTNLINLVSDTLWELNDNIVYHSSDKGKNKGFGFVYVQNYPNKHELKIAFVDTGIGIPESLRKKEKYKYLTKLEALTESMKIHATSKDIAENQQGMGLYNVDLFVQKNKGQIEIFSGDCYYNRNGENSPEINVYPDRFYWQGTAIFVTFKTNNKISYKELFGDKDNYFEVISSRIDD
jgi:anti-sigma regulatory factor (Ser/Thr protein kinase)